jgi:hypothetical protein
LTAPSLDSPGGKIHPGEKIHIFPCRAFLVEDLPSDHTDYIFILLTGNPLEISWSNDGHHTRKKAR